MSVDPGEVLSAAQWLDTSADEFAGDVDGLMKQVRAVVGGEWRGDAAGSHEDAWNVWADGARRVVSALYADATLLRQAAAGYIYVDSGTRDRIAGHSGGEEGVGD